MYTYSVVAKRLGCRLKIKLRQLKEGVKHLMLLEELPVVPYSMISGQKSSRWLLFFQPANLPAADT